MTFSICLLVYLYIFYNFSENLMNIFYFIFVLIIVISLFLFFKFSRKKKLSKEKIKYFKEIKNKNLLIKSEKEKLINSDKIYHKILLELSYNWTFWEILKKKPKEISNINKIWELHKIRNKLVHDFDLFDEKNLSMKNKDYELEINNILNYVS